MLEPSACVKLMMANACCKQTYSTTGLANSAQNQSVHNVEIHVCRRNQQPSTELEQDNLSQSNIFLPGVLGCDSGCLLGLG